MDTAFLASVFIVFVAAWSQADIAAGYITQKLQARKDSKRL